MSEYICIWEYWIKNETQSEFELIYGSDGKWVKLFRRAPGFLQTSLLQDCSDPTHYITIDRWKSEHYFFAFKDAFSEAYLKLDKLSSYLTINENHIGNFKI